MKITWCTDIHLDHADKKSQDIFFNLVKEQNSDAVIIGGDISNGKDIIKHLSVISENLSSIPIYFVLGNHDYYGSSIYFIWDQVKSFCDQVDNLHWLDRSGVIPLTDKTALIGSGLWCDWKAGDYQRSTVWIGDYDFILELKVTSFGPYGNISLLRETLQKFALQHATQLKNDLETAICDYENIIALTHVPPFWEGSFAPNGKVQDLNWAPHFVCQTAGDFLKDIMKDSESFLTVLSGHTHGAGTAQIANNIKAVNGHAKYKHPSPQEVITVL